MISCSAVHIFERFVTGENKESQHPVGKDINLKERERERKK